MREIQDVFPVSMDAIFTHLAQARPLLFQDLAKLLSASPDAARQPLSQEDSIIARGRNLHIAVYTDHPALIDNLLRDEGDRQVLHLFESPARLINFFIQPGAIDLTAHALYQPWLLQPDMIPPHVGHWLSQTTITHWPWHLDKDKVTTGPAAPLVSDLVTAMAGQLQLLGSQIAQRLNTEHYPPGGATPDQILAAGERPLRVQIMALEHSRYQKYCARDIARALDEYGVETDIALLEMTQAFYVDVLRSIERFVPDVLFLNGRDRHGLRALPERLHLVSWDQDYALSPHPTHAAGRAPQDRLLLMVRDWRNETRRHGIPDQVVHHVNLGTNTDLYHPPAEDSADRPVEHEILFVGNVFEWEPYKQVIDWDKLAEPTQHLMERAIELLDVHLAGETGDEPFVMPDVSELVEAAMRDVGLQFGSDAESWLKVCRYFRYRVAHMRLRQHYITNLADLNLSLFGNGWDAFPAVESRWRGPMENGPDLREAIHRSAINLHLHTWTVHHPRLYDTAAAGGFLLVGRVDESYPLEEVFTPGVELDTFGSLPELRDKIRYYLDHPDERNAMAARAADRARREHRMADRMRTVLDLLETPAHHETHHPDETVAAGRG